MARGQGDTRPHLDGDVCLLLRQRVVPLEEVNESEVGGSHRPHLHVLPFEAFQHLDRVVEPPFLHERHREINLQLLLAAK